jgi:hypothetical protein
LPKHRRRFGLIAKILGLVVLGLLGALLQLLYEPLRSLSGANRRATADHQPVAAPVITAPATVPRSLGPQRFASAAGKIAQLPPPQPELQGRPLKQQTTRLRPRSTSAPRDEPEVSQRITDYLHGHRLPLVQAQVLRRSDGSRNVMLFGFVATQLGKDHAETRVREFLGESQLEFDNRIAIRPELRSQPESTPGTTALRSDGNSLEISLPKIFAGCWQGVVPSLDSQVYLGGPGIGAWMTKTYRLCYERVNEGPFTLTFGDTGLENSVLTRLHGVSNVNGQVQVLSSDGASRASIRAYLHFQEAPLLLGLVPLGLTGQVDETNTLSCIVNPDSTMFVQASVLGQFNGRPWIAAKWHATFSHALR